MWLIVSSVLLAFSFALSPCSPKTQNPEPHPPQVNVSKVWLTVSSVLLAFSFVFGTAIRNTFESVVFLFVVHPYDVGDVLLLTDPSDTAKGPQYCQVAALQTLSLHRLINRGLASFQSRAFIKF